MSVPKGYRFGPRFSRKRGRKASDGLTKLQIAVLAEIGNGLSTKEIAYKLGKSPKTVEYHRMRLSDIFNALRNPVKLARIAIGFGLSSLCVLLIAGCTSTTPVTPPPPAPPTNAPPKAALAPTPLAKPQRFQTTTVTLAWNPSTNVAGYIFNWGTGPYTPGQPFTNFSNTVLTSLTHVHLTGLRVGIVYYFDVKIRNSDPDNVLAWKAALWPNSTVAPLQ